MGENCWSTKHPIQLLPSLPVLNNKCVNAHWRPTFVLPGQSLTDTRTLCYALTLLIIRCTDCTVSQSVRQCLQPRQLLLWPSQSPIVSLLHKSSGLHFFISPGDCWKKLTISFISFFLHTDRHTELDNGRRWRQRSDYQLPHRQFGKRAQGTFCQPKLGSVSSKNSTQRELHFSQTADIERQIWQTDVSLPTILQIAPTALSP